MLRAAGKASPPPAARAAAGDGEVAGARATPAPAGLCAAGAAQGAADSAPLHASVYRSRTPLRPPSVPEPAPAPRPHRCCCRASAQCRRLPAARRPRRPPCPPSPRPLLLTPARPRHRCPRPRTTKRRAVAAPPRRPHGAALLRLYLRLAARGRRSIGWQLQGRETRPLNLASSQQGPGCTTPAAGESAGATAAAHLHPPSL